MATIPGLVLVSALVGVPLLGEWWLSTRHARVLRARGAVEPVNDVHAAMALVYPALFLGALLEGSLRHSTLAPAGGLLFLLAKALKYWAMVSLGERWTFRVLVLPAVPLVAAGPYRWLRHPNYVAVLAEIVGVAWLVRAPVAGVVGLVAFGVLLRTRMRVEEQALGLASGGASRLTSERSR